jgi:sugar phosphate isomerase/epimerase
MPLGLSTVYYSRDVKDGDRLLELILELGFDGLELEYRLAPETLAAMLPAIKQRDVRVFSVHNFMSDPGRESPGGKGGHDLYLMSSLDPEERARAVERTLVTMDVAREAGAKVVILHLGRVEFPGRLARYKRLLAAGERDTPEASRLLGDFLVTRQNSREPYFQAVLSCLDRLNREAQNRGLLLGIENRYHVREIPDHLEMGMILSAFEGGSIRYWHDVGHALHLEYLGVGSQEDWLGSYAGNLAGIHLHDIKGPDDHLPPGTGEADFASILTNLPEEAVRIMEVRGLSPLPELMAARDHLLSLGF